MTSNLQTDIIAIVGKSNSGKTTLMEQLIRALTQKGYTVGSVKHAHDGFEMDTKGKDSWRHKRAGASAALVLSSDKAALIKEDPRPYLNKINDYLQDMDMVLVEGLKSSSLPKIEIFRTDAGHQTPAATEDQNLIAFVTDTDLRPNVPCFDPDNISGIIDFIEKRHQGIKHQ